MLNFSLRKITYTVLAISLTVAIYWQTQITYPEITKTHPYSDALIYQALAKGELPYYGSTHITHRVTVSGLAGIIHKMGLPLEWSFALINLAILTLVLWRVYRVKDGLVWSFLVFLTLSMPAFWRGFFLPMTDTFLWGFLTLFLLEANKERPNLIALFLLFSVALFSKELAILVIPFTLLSSIPNKKIVLFSTVLPLVTWLFLETNYSVSNTSNYLFHPEWWWNDITKNFSLNLLWLPKYLLSGFAGLLVVYAYRWFITGKKFIWEITPELLLFLLLVLIAPENSPRILFSFTGMFVLRLTKLA